VEDAIEAPGLRLVLSAGVPGPWGEAAKGIFHVKGLAYLKVRQVGGMPNEELLHWTGHDNAPIAIFEKEAPRDGWAEILFLAERLAAKPALIPEDIVDRVRMFGLAREICGEQGFGWLRRLMILDPLLSAEANLPDSLLEVPHRLGNKYGYSKSAAKAAPRRVAEILDALSEQLLAQRRRGSRYFIGDELSALDIYWATFAVMFEPLSQELCPIPEGLRHGYRMPDGEARSAAHPILLEHRDWIYDCHLELPLDF